jgi:hypothetical protein
MTARTSVILVDVESASVRGVELHARVSEAFELRVLILQPPVVHPPHRVDWVQGVGCLSPVGCGAVRNAQVSPTDWQCDMQGGSCVGPVRLLIGKYSHCGPG